MWRCALLMVSVSVVTMVTAGGSDSQPLPQNWTHPLLHPHPQFHTSSSGNKSSGNGRTFPDLPVGQLPSAAGRFNLLPMAGPPGAFYKTSQYQDKSTFRTGAGAFFTGGSGKTVQAQGFSYTPQSAFRTNAGNGGFVTSSGTGKSDQGFSYTPQSTFRTNAGNGGFVTTSGSGKSDQGFSYTPRLPNAAVQEPIQSRLGGFTFPQNAPTVSGHRFFTAAAGFPPVGFYGVKNPPGQPFPLPPPQNLRGSRVYDNISYKPRDPNKKTGVYVVPTPSKLYFDGVKN